MIGFLLLFAAVSPSDLGPLFPRPLRCRRCPWLLFIPVILVFLVDWR